MPVAAHGTRDHFPHGLTDMDRKWPGRGCKSLGNCGLNVEGRAHGAQRVVAVRTGSAEQRHGGVADVLVDHPAVPIDGRVDYGEEALEPRMDLFGGQLRRELSISDNVAEHDSDGPSVAFATGAATGDSGLALAERPAATAAEAVRGVIRVTAFLAWGGESRAARGAELPAFLVCGLARRTEHRRRSLSVGRPIGTNISTSAPRL